MQAAHPQVLALLPHTCDHAILSGRAVQRAKHIAVAVDERHQTVPFRLWLKAFRQQRGQAPKVGEGLALTAAEVEEAK